VLATKFSDGDPGDHWGVGFYDGERNGRHYVKDGEGNQLRGNGFRRVGRIHKDAGALLLIAAREWEKRALAGENLNLWNLVQVHPPHPQAPEPPEVAWLIESGSPAKYLKRLDLDLIIWIDDPNAALAFATKSDAEAYLSRITIEAVNLPSDIRICDHLGIPQAPEPPSSLTGGQGKVTDEMVKRAIGVFEHAKEGPEGMYINTHAGVRAVVEFVVDQLAGGGK